VEENPILQILTGALPVEVKARIDKQKKILQNKIRRQADDAHRKKENARRRKKYKDDPEYRAKISEARKRWWARKTDEEKAEIIFRAKVARMARVEQLPPEQVEARYQAQLAQKKRKYQENAEHRELLKEKDRARRASMSKEERQREYRKRKETEAALPETEKARRRELRKARLKRYRENKKLKLIANRQGELDGTREEHSGRMPQQRPAI